MGEPLGVWAPNGFPTKTCKRQESQLEEWERESKNYHLCSDCVSVIICWPLLSPCFSGTVLPLPLHCLFFLGFRFYSISFFNVSRLILTQLLCRFWESECQKTRDEIIFLSHDEIIFVYAINKGERGEVEHPVDVTSSIWNSPVWFASSPVTIATHSWLKYGVWIARRVTLCDVTKRNRSKSEI